MKSIKKFQLKMFIWLFLGVFVFTSIVPPALASELGGENNLEIGPIERQPENIPEPIEQPTAEPSDEIIERDDSSVISSPNSNNPKTKIIDYKLDNKDDILLDNEDQTPLDMYANRDNAGLSRKSNPVNIMLINSPVFLVTIILCRFRPDGLICSQALVYNTTIARLT